MVDTNINAKDVQNIIEGRKSEMYENVNAVQEELGKIELEGKSKNNLVKVTLTGQHEMKNLSMSSDLLKKSNKDVEICVMEAYKDARAKVEAKVKEKMVQVAESLGFYG